MQGSEPSSRVPSVDSILLTVVRIQTFAQGTLLTNASGFFFERNDALFLVTCGHVMLDMASNHLPDRIEIELHTDSSNLARSIGFSIPLYRHGKPIWRQGSDAAGKIDVAMIEVHRDALPKTAIFQSFTPAHLQSPTDPVEVGTPLVVVGFPLGFHDALHHIPVVRHAIVASPFGLRFQGMGYFLTDARTHRGTSGAPIVMRVPDSGGVLGRLPWRVLGVHSARFDVGTRDTELDEVLGLNCVWYTDTLMTLSAT